MNTFPSLHLEGGFFSPDLFENRLDDQLPGQKAQDFGLPKQRDLTNEIAAVFHDARALWQGFRHRLETLSEDDPATTETRAHWVLPFLRLLGYELEYQPRAFEIDGLTFAISHTLTPSPSAQHPTPVHIVGWRQDLGRVAPSGRPRLSPHALVQEYLNRSEALWGIVTNGRVLRLLRDSTFVRRQAYLEFDLEGLFEQERFADFVLLYRLLHRTRLPKDGRAEDCWLEQYYQQSIEQGGRVRERLREGVEKCLNLLANGFLAHPKSSALRQWVQREGSLAFYQQLLRLVYRFLFLLVAEERGLMGSNPLYLEHYGISRLRRLVDRYAAYTDDADLWLGLRALWAIFQKDSWAETLGVSPLNGELFAHQDLDDAWISNRDLLKAFCHLAYYDKPPRRINYAALDTEELGSVYESLLDYHPVVEDADKPPHFNLRPGSERKSTGSYYTPPLLVNELIRSALEPVIRERLKALATPEERERALLSIKVCDPACGSGHFLLAAARRLGKELARVRTGEDEPAPEQVRLAIRDVITHCLYGVDKNPLAVELARVALWLEGHTEGKPLTFLEHRIRHGDSLVGVFDLNVLSNGIPDEAFTPLTGDDKGLTGALRRQNRTEREQYALFDWKHHVGVPLEQWEVQLREIAELPDDSVEQVRLKRDRYRSQWENPELRRQRRACDLWTAAFFQTFNRQEDRNFITTNTVRGAVSGRAIDPQLAAWAEVLAAEVGFFHWPLEFPEVFARGGFDVLLANPPWERIKLQEQEFFAARDPRIANAPNAAARERLIKRLPQENPALWEAYRRALHTAESTSRFLRASGDYPLTARGGINTYSVFAERIRRLLSPQGRAGVILPTGIAADANNQHFFADLMEQGQIASLYDFDNRAKWFPAVVSLMKFCLLTLTGEGRANAQPQFAFFCHLPEDIRKAEKSFSLTRHDLALLNPNTCTLPVFRTRVDADLTRAIYRRVPVLVNEQTGENPWGVRFLLMLNMANDSHLFRTREQLEREGYRLVGNRFVRPSLPEGERPHPISLPEGEAYLPLYEAKMIWLYDHRYGTYAGRDDRSSTQLPALNEPQHADPACLPLPWYWVAAGEVQARLENWRHDWLLALRRIARSTDERTAIFSLLPRAGVGDSASLLFYNTHDTLHVACFLASVNNLVFDYFTRQKITNSNMNPFYTKQLPVLPPSAYTPDDLAFIVPRVLELVYTAWDIKPFADDVWRDSLPHLRQRIDAQWEANRAATGGHEWVLPPWIQAYPEIETDPQKGIPLPPFRWDETRRAVICAELDAYYARLYGLTRKQLRYILDPADLTPRELEDILDPQEEVNDPLDPQGYAERCAQSHFPGETFRVLKTKEVQRFGEYRTRRLVLEAWERLKDVKPAVIEMRTEPVSQKPRQAVEPSTHPRKPRRPSFIIIEDDEDDEQASLNPQPATASKDAEYTIYRCQECGKLVLGFDREVHRQRAHMGQTVRFEKIR